MLLGSISEPFKAKSILDIGSGTGVLALMLAQKSNSEEVFITALESDNLVIEILKENINNKPFQTKIEVVHGQLQTYKPVVPFDYIICNPPYYLVNQTIDHLVESGLKNRLTQRNEAELPIRYIIDFLSKYLNPKGNFFAICPLDYYETFVSQLTEVPHLKVTSLIKVYSFKESLSPIRIIFEVNKSIEDQIIIPEEKDFVIYESTNQYSEVYIELTKDYHFKDLSKTQS